MRAEPLPVVCPVCNDEVEGKLREHLLAHEKEALASELLAYVEAEERGDTFSE